MNISEGEFASLASLRALANRWDFIADQKDTWVAEANQLAKCANELRSELREALANDERGAATG